jgi:hypothetical protein
VLLSLQAQLMQLSLVLPVLLRLELLLAPLQLKPLSCHRAPRLPLALIP